MRIFLAVFPPIDVQELAFAAAQRLKRAGESAGIPAGGVSWVKRENLHYTLSFLGELGDDGARRAGEAALEAAADLKKFDVALGSLGAFPNARRARVLWAGLTEGAEPFVTLARRVEAALVKRGFDREERPFSPHLTIGRVRDPRHDWSPALAAAASPAANPAARFHVESIRVVKSTLSPQGSRYEVLVEAMLGG